MKSQTSTRKLIKKLPSLLVVVAGIALLLYQINCSRPVHKTNIDLMAAKPENPPLQYQINTTVLLYDYSYIFSDADFSQRNEYVDKAAKDIFAKIFGQSSEDSKFIPMVIDLNFNLMLESLRWSWDGTLHVTIHEQNSDKILFDKTDIGKFEFYSSVPDTSKKTQYNIVFNSLAKSIESMIDELQSLPLSPRPVGYVENKEEIVENDSAKTTTDPDGFYLMTERQLDNEFEYIKHISKKWNKQQFQKLSITEKREFLKKYWQQFYQAEIIIENEYRRDYLSRVSYANKSFRHGSAEGWKSDRGRVLLKYGYPNDVERYVSNLAQREYEVWFYYALEGGAEFYFVDHVGLGELELVHSTAESEIHDYDWVRWTIP